MNRSAGNLLADWRKFFLFLVFFRVRVVKVPFLKELSSVTQVPETPVAAVPFKFPKSEMELSHSSVQFHHLFGATHGEYMGEKLTNS